MKTFLKGWYLIYTRPRQEKKVHAELAEKKIESFLPMRKVLRLWHDRRKYIDEPLFPSYVFVYLETLRSYYDGINLDGSLYYVRAGCKVARVSEKVISNIRMITCRGQDIEVSDANWQPGRQLVISKGVLTGLACEVVRVDGKQKILVRVNLLRRSLLLSMPTENLMAI